MDKQGKLGTLVIGIIAVIFLHVGFFVFVANDHATHVELERERDGSGPNLAIVPTGKMPAALQPAPADPMLAKTISGPADDTVETAVAPARLRPVAVKDDRKPALSAYKPKRATMHMIVKPQFSPVTTTIAYAANKPFDPAPDAALVGKVKSVKKRSFMSRVLPVIKKPYDWLKAVGSKLK